MKSTWTIGKKITFGFTLVLILMSVVGITGYISLNNSKDAMEGICYQLDIAKKANTILVDSQDAQAGALRYVIYGEDKYNDSIITEKANVIENAQAAQGMMKSEENKRVAEDVINKITDYSKATQEYYDLAQKRIAAGTIRSKASLGVRDAIKAILDAQFTVVDKCAKETADGKVTDYQKVTNTFLAQTARNSFDSARILAQKYQLATTPEAQDAIAKEWIGEIETTRENLKACQASFKDPQALKQIDNALTSLDSYLEQVQTFRSVNRDQRDNQINKQKPAADAVMAQARQVRDGVYDFIDKVEEQSNASIAFANVLICCVGIGAVVAGVAAAFSIAVGINRALKRIVDGLTSGAEQTASAAGQVSSASQSLAQGASEQAAALEETTSSIEEMSSMVKQNAANANEATNLAASATADADTGTQAMGQMSKAIDDIKKSSDETAKIIKTIDEIAFQTNLLALNAAVEAARAGEAGKGFAVVAEEVRNLAQRSAQAAKDTANMIAESVKNADNGVSINKEVAQTLNKIAEGSRKVNDLVAEIAAASNEQAQGIDQINTAVGQMDQVTQSNAANAEESASAAEELSSQAEELNGMVGQLQAMVGGKGATSGSRTGNHISFQADRGASHGDKARQKTAHPNRNSGSHSPEDMIPFENEKELSQF